MLYEMLSNTARRFPSRHAIEFGDQELTYQDLHTSVDDFSAELSALGIGEGSPAIVLLPNGPEFAVATFALAKLGAIIVPLNAAFQSKEIQYYLADSKAQAIITTAKLAAQHEDVASAVDPACALITSVPVGSGPSADQAPDEEKRSPYRGDAIYQYSSGSTGTPKRVIRTQTNLVHEAANFTSTTNATHEDRILAVVPLFHAHGFGNCLLAACCVGATMVILPSFNPKRVAQVLQDKQITVFPGVPFMFSILADSPSIDAAPFPALRLAFSAGAPLTQGTYESFLEKFNVPVRQLYGSTETGSVAVNLGSTADELWASIGKPIANIEVEIVDDDGRPVGPGELGEIIIASPAMTKGYANLEAVNRETFRDGYFWTGDLGKRDEDGNVFITGRKKLFINAGGNKVDPGEIEAVIAQHPAVSESVVLGVKGGYGQEIIKAVIVTKDDTTCNGDDIKQWCKARVAEFKVPRIVEFREEIPRSPLGKILRKYLQEELQT